MDVWRQTGEKPKTLEDKPQMPAELAYIWHWFMELMNKDGIKFAEVESWAKIKGIELLDYELDSIMMLDRIYWEVKNNA